jgi:hypothetical protein
MDIINKEDINSMTLRSCDILFLRITGLSGKVYHNGQKFVVLDIVDRHTIEIGMVELNNGLHKFKDSGGLIVRFDDEDEFQSIIGGI